MSDDQPVIIRHDGNGHLHCENGPALFVQHRLKEWRIHGSLHRDDGPARISAKAGLWRQGTCPELTTYDIEPAKTEGTNHLWYRQGIPHRENGPAVVNANSSQWWEHGQLRRMDLTHADPKVPLSITFMQIQDPATNCHQTAETFNQLLKMSDREPNLARFINFPIDNQHIMERLKTVQLARCAQHGNAPEKLRTELFRWCQSNNQSEHMIPLLHTITLTEALHLANITGNPQLLVDHPGVNDETRTLLLAAL